MSGSEDGRVLIWDVNTKDILQEWQAHDEAVLAVDTHAEKEIIVTCSLDGGIKIWSNEAEQGFQHEMDAAKSFEDMGGVHIGDVAVNGTHEAEMMDYDTPDEVPSSAVRE